MAIQGKIATNRQGFANFGGARIPPIPQHIILTDRDDGTEWVLMHDATGQYVGISDAGVGRRKDFIVFHPWDGPTLDGFPNVRMLIRGGRLGYELIDASRHKTAQQLVLTRRRVERRILELIVPTVIAVLGFSALGYREIRTND